MCELKLKCIVYKIGTKVSTLNLIICTKNSYLIKHKETLTKIISTQDYIITKFNRTKS